MTAMSAARKMRTAAGALVGVLLTGAALTGCGGADADRADTEEHAVASGVVLDGPKGSPVSGTEVELVVWPAPQQSTGGQPSAGPQLQTVDTDTTDADGRFDLEALAGELTPHAGTDGRVGIEIRVVGDQSGTRTSVQLERADDTGETTVVENTGLVLVAPRH